MFWYLSILLNLFIFCPMPFIKLSQRYFQFICKLSHLFFWPFRILFKFLIEVLSILQSEKIILMPICTQKLRMIHMISIRTINYLLHIFGDSFALSDFILHILHQFMDKLIGQSWVIILKFSGGIGIWLLWLLFINRNRLNIIGFIAI